jgi:hypothetical protein
VSRQCPRHETLKPHAACRLALRLRRSSSAISTSLRRSARYSSQAHPKLAPNNLLLFLGVIGENGLAFDTSGPVARVIHLMRGGAMPSAHALLVLPSSAIATRPVIDRLDGMLREIASDIRMAQGPHRGASGDLDLCKFHQLARVWSSTLGASSRWQTIFGTGLQNRV